MHHSLSRRYAILAPNVLPKGFVDARAATEKLMEATKLDEGEYRLGFTKVCESYSLSTTWPPPFLPGSLAPPYSAFVCLYLECIIAVGLAGRDDSREKIKA